MLDGFVEDIVDEGETFAIKDGNTIELETGLISMGSKYHAAYLEKFNFCYSLLPISPSSGVSLPIFNCFLLRLSCFHNDLICL